MHVTFIAGLIDRNVFGVHRLNAIAVDVCRRGLESNCQLSFAVCGCVSVGGRASEPFLVDDLCNRIETTVGTIVQIFFDIEQKRIDRVVAGLFVCSLRKCITQRRQFGPSNRGDNPIFDHHQLNDLVFVAVGQLRWLNV